MNFKIFILLACLGSVGLVSGCASSTHAPTILSGNPAAPPAPPSELPSALRFPESIAIDTSAVTNGPGGALAALAIGDPFGNELDFVSLSVNFLLNFPDDTVLAPLHDLLIPIGTNVTNFEDAIFVGDVLKNIKIDFSPFTYDSLGRGEDCSGSTGQLPICYRIWINNVKTLAGIFDVYPTDTNPGSGRFKGFPLDDHVDGLIGAVYDHRDPLDKMTEIFNATNGFNEFGHGLLTQNGEQGLALKTVNLIFTENSNETMNVARFFDDQNFLSMSQDSNQIGHDNFTAACANLTTKRVVDQQNCLDIGVDVTGIPYVVPGVQDDVLLPFVFPTSPTFASSRFHSL